MDTLPLYQVVLAYPPFDDWGEHRTLNIPLWRAVDRSKSLLALVGKIEHIYRLMQCLKGWNYAFHHAYCYGDKVILLGRMGAMECPKLKGLFGLRRKLFPLGEPRLLINDPKRGISKMKRDGWDTWTPFGWHQIDLYAYPVRRTHVIVDESILDAAQDFKRIWEEGTGWRWRFGDALMRLIHGQNIPPMEAYKWAHEAIGGQLSISQIAAFCNLAEAVPPSQRDLTIPWTNYYDTVIRT